MRASECIQRMGLQLALGALLMTAAHGTAHAFPYIVPEYFEVRGAFTTSIGNLTTDATVGSGLHNLGNGWGVEAIHGGPFPALDILFRGAAWQAGRFELMREYFGAGATDSQGRR